MAGRLARAVPSANAPVAGRKHRHIWGSDWPHPSEPTAAKPDDRILLDLLQAWVPGAAARQRALVDNPAELYGFEGAT
jgi:predicted TIM-barrel fold metal-dependent hydrolase